MNKLFYVHQLNEIGINKARSIAYAFDNLLSELEQCCGVDSREFSIGKTKLEEACFFFKKAMASKEENQIQDAVKDCP